MGTDEELKKRLVRQDFSNPCNIRQDVLEHRIALTQLLAETENGIAVLSDFHKETSYIYSGRLGDTIGFMKAATIEPSAFEEKIFDLIPNDELMDRHVLELRFLQLQKKLPINERPCYNTICSLHFQINRHKNIPILHRTYYLESLPNGSIWLALCLYTPFVENGKLPIRNIINNHTGEILLPETCEQLGKQVLSTREIAVLNLLAKGLSSKQIANTLHISVNTVYRHRQNILSALQVKNTAAAVKIAIRLQMIS